MRRRHNFSKDEIEWACLKIREGYRTDYVADAFCVSTNALTKALYRTHGISIADLLAEPIPLFYEGGDYDD